MTLQLLFFAFTTALLLTYLIRGYSLHKNFLDHPNNRSSHTVATPKGGGLAIMVTFFAFLSYFYEIDFIDESLFYSLLMVLPIVVVSLIDDIFPLSAKLRFGVQLISASGALYFLNGISTFNFVIFSLDGLWLNIFALIAIVWMTNLYNFLDGIDGYAASEVIFVGSAAYILFGNNISLLLAASTAGFLVFNWSKASIFMGDVGSAPIGFIFSVLILSDAGTAHLSAWLILLSLFWFDATITLIRRMKKGENLAQAHKKHVYQRVTQLGFGHDKVVMMAMLLNIIIFTAIYFTDESYHLYLFFVLIVLLYALTKWIDTKKVFE